MLTANGSADAGGLKRKARSIELQGSRSWPILAAQLRSVAAQHYAKAEAFVTEVPRSGARCARYIGNLAKHLGRRYSDKMSEDSSREPAIRAIAMPADANAGGDIFGGWLLSQMDLAGGSRARLRAKGRVVTVAITGMSFDLPVFIGDEVSCYAEIVRVGRTSIQMKIESFARRQVTGERVKVTEGLFTYVAIDCERRPRLVPPES